MLNTPSVRTVLGDIPAATLGHTQPHEHVLSDFSAVIGPTRLTPTDPSVTKDAIPSEWPASKRALVDAPVTIENHDWVKRNVVNRDNLQMTDVRLAIEELALYKAAGGETVVDSTSVGLGRDPNGLARVSRATGVNIVMGSGYYARDWHPQGLTELTVDQIRDEVIHDVEIGVGTTGIRAGIIGEIGLSWPVDEVEDRVLRASAQAQVATGAALQIHPGREPESCIDAVKKIVAAGGDPRRTIMSHIDRTIFELDQMKELAATGCVLELDLFGQESSYYAFNPAARRPNDATRIEWLQALIEAGHGEQLVISQDICQKVYLHRFGGPGYAHILDNVIPLMRTMGMSEDTITLLTRGNPARLLALTKDAT
ncbi:MAG: phosphotriesterase-related protein [Glaciecola sp.]|jgi:phosphotriesterase-related protein